MNGEPDIPARSDHIYLYIQSGVYSDSIGGLSTKKKN